MDFYRPWPADGFEWALPCDRRHYEAFSTFDGEPRASKWQPVPMDRIREDEGQTLLPSDFPWFSSSVLVMRRSAVDALRDMLDRNGELLALATDDAVELFAYNCRVIDALDESRAEVVRFTDSGGIMDIATAAFHPWAVRDVDAFRLPHRASSTYVSQRFVDRVRGAELHGLEFRWVAAE